MTAKICQGFFNNSGVIPEVSERNVAAKTKHLPDSARCVTVVHVELSRRVADRAFSILRLYHKGNLVGRKAVLALRSPVIYLLSQLYAILDAPRFSVFRVAFVRTDFAGVLRANSAAPFLDTIKFVCGFSFAAKLAQLWGHFIDKIPGYYFFLRECFSSTGDFSVIAAAGIGLEGSDIAFRADLLGSAVATKEPVNASSCFLGVDANRRPSVELLAGYILREIARRGTCSLSLG
jgi:hypothetical protein